MQACPISLRSIDTSEVRIVSFFVALSMFVLLLYPDISLGISALLLFDFGVRWLRLARLSPLSLAAKQVKRWAGIESTYGDESPKRFALVLGLLTVLVIVIVSLGQYTTAIRFFASVLFVCAFLEALFDFCIGCRIYYLLKLLKVI